MRERRYRLSNYNYSTARGYMVTLKMHRNAAPLSKLDPTRKRGIAYTSLTPVFTDVIMKRLIAYFKGTVAVRRFILMPNHIHILFYLKRRPNYPPTNLIHVVKTCITFLTEAYHQTLGPTDFTPIHHEWDDSIAFTPEAYRRMIRYIDDNPIRAQRRRASDFCKCRTYYAKDGQQWWYYGNFDLVKRPTILAVECSRQIALNSPLWQQWHATAQSLPTEAAAIGTFMSPCEKMVQDTLIQQGTSLIILLPQGISPYWHPSSEMEALCAQGRILYLTPFAYEAAQPPIKLLFQRCHEGGGLKEVMRQIACNITPPPRQ